MREWVDRLVGRRYDAVVAVSEATRRLLADRYGYPERKLWTIPNGWFGDPRPRNPSSGHRIICVANFRPQKGHDVLLAAFAKVLDSVPDAELVLVGEGPLRSDLEDESRRLHIAERVQFAGLVPDVWRHLASADVFALASRYEPLGMAALEAMAAGLPVVATDVGGLTDLVEPRVTGELVEPNDPLALSARLVALLNAPTAMTAMGAAGREQAAAHRGERMTEQYLDLYSHLTDLAQPNG
jgi:glycosyltransferase involved in cell wall biosynthesis